MLVDSDTNNSRIWDEFRNNLIHIANMLIRITICYM